jgi:glycosyltransferase involved in cell wall biosynthesis
MSNDIAVTVICLTYNHENYIRKCLDGFVSQKTNFKYEIIVHDDASTDNTANIIKEYAQKYNDKIIPILQTENQFSKKVPIYKTFCLELVHGKYIAITEGDDYWIDPLKLQKQYDALEQNPSCNMCLHKVQRVDADENILPFTHPNFSLATGVISSKEFVDLINYKKYGECFQTSCDFFLAKPCIEYYNTPIKFREVAAVGDVPLMLYFGSIGDVYYIDDIMSCYRKFAIGSWSSKEVNSSVDSHIIHSEKIIKMMKEFDKFSNEKYHDSCVYKIQKNEYNIEVLKENYKNAIKSYYSYFKEESLKIKFKILIGAYLPNLYQLIMKKRHPNLK